MACHEKLHVRVFVATMSKELYVISVSENIFLPSAAVCRVLHADQSEPEVKLIDWMQSSLRMHP